MQNMTDDESDYEYHDDYDSNEAYQEALARIRGGSRVDSIFLPSPLQVSLRRADLAWLQLLGFGEKFIQNAMQHDTPDPLTVRNLIERGMTVKEIEKRFARFME
jgi:hypothetical protein